MAAHKKEDPRSVRSKRMFKQAVFSLLADNPDISQLTVQKIANRAELNRATFYLHYEDINDLLRQIVREIFDDLSSKIEPLLGIQNRDEHEQLVTFLHYMHEYRRLFTVLFEHKGVRQNMFSLIKRTIVKRREMRPARLKSQSVSVDILASSLLGIILWWIKDAPEYSSEQIAEQVTLLYRRPPM